MQRHFDTELDSLKTNIIKMGTLVEEALDQSIQSLLRRDRTLAQSVIERDDRINELEVENDRAIIDLLVLQQPVAIDLRFILATQKINNDLERIGDHAVNIAESAINFIETSNPWSLPELPKMTDSVKAMFNNSLNGFIHQDHRLAKSVLSQDDVIDDFNRTLIKLATEKMKSDPTLIDIGLEMIRISRNLERIADLSTNIAEEVIFIARAELIKHSGRKT